MSKTTVVYLVYDGHNCKDLNDLKELIVKFGKTVNEQRSWENDIKAVAQDVEGNYTIILNKETKELTINTHNIMTSKFNCWVTKNKVSIQKETDMSVLEKISMKTVKQSLKPEVIEKQKNKIRDLKHPLKECK